MFKTFKNRMASSSTQHLALAFTLVMSFFFNNMLMAQLEVNVNLSITEEGRAPYSNHIRGNLVALSPNATNESYNINVNVSEFPEEGVQGVNINLGDGQIHYMDLGGVPTPVKATFSVSYSDFSSKSISATLVLNDPSLTPASWSRTLKRFQPNRAISSGTYQTPDETVAVSNINMHIKYAPSNAQHRLNKPLIFVEGIDFKNTVVYDMTGKPARVGSFGWDIFVTGMVDNLEDSDNQTFALLPQFVNQMLADGYDIVFCDFQNGTAAIEDNGRALINVINEVNRRKKEGLTSKQRCYSNSVIGASMGGQVARWALRTMENEGTDHDSGLYFSMDSPHKGANIPLALQAFLWFGANHGPDSGDRRSMSKTWEELNSPAAKQLLAFHLGSQSEHPAYMSMMNQLGYPQQTRNIASANGSGSGQNQGYNNNGELANASANMNVASLGTVKVFGLTLNASGANTIAKFDRIFEGPKLSNLLSIPTGHMSLERQGSNSVVLKGAEINIPLLGLLTFSAYSNSRTLNFSKDMTMWDNAPGGNRNDIASEVLPPIVEALEEYWSSSQGPSGKQCFIPTVSALDLATDDMHTNAGNFVGILSNPNTGSTPFKSVFISNDNEAHVFMSPGLLTFARNEIITNTKISCRQMIMEEPAPQEQGELRSGN